MVKPGTGTWKSVTGLAKLQRRYLDGSEAKRRTSGNFFEADTLAANPPPDRLVPVKRRRCGASRHSR